MELAYLVVSVAGMLVAVSVSIHQEKKRDRELDQCLNELACLTNPNGPPDEESQRIH